MFVALFLASAGAAALAACGSDKVCTVAEVQACDANLSTCIAKPECNDPTNSGYQACVDGCQKAHCDCLSACGDTCSH